MVCVRSFVRQIRLQEIFDAVRMLSALVGEYPLFRIFASAVAFFRKQRRSGCRVMECVAVSFLSMLMLNSCFAPGVGYAYSSSVVTKRTGLAEKLKDFLPENEKTDLSAQDEARWLADTAYIASAEIARQYEPILPNWFNNGLVNIGLRERGLCWHYQHDLYRELRRRPLKYFRIGVCVRDRAKMSEHNCVYVTGRENKWPDCIILDAWLWNGRLSLKEKDEITENWADLPVQTKWLNLVCPEGHTRSKAHWFMLRGKNRKYYEWYTKEGRESSQYALMVENIRKEKQRENQRAAGQ